jgi:hypothetical protein
VHLVRTGSSAHNQRTYFAKASAHHVEKAERKEDVVWVLTASVMGSCDNLDQKASDRILNRVKTYIMRDRA